MSGSGAIFYDGRTARRRIATLWLAPEGIDIQEGGQVLARWSYGALRREDAAPGVLRLSAGDLARLEVHDPALQEEIRLRCPGLGLRNPAERHRAGPIVAWSLAAAVSIVLTVLYLVPLLADRLAPLIPHALERRLGDAVDNQVRQIFSAKACTGPAGTAALGRLADELRRAGAQPVRFEVAVLDSPIPNAIALPGGRIYLFKGLLRRAKDIDEVAGVLAHEIGHVAHRDGLRGLIRASGTSFLLGLLFGDVLGAGVVLTAGHAVLDSAHSRSQESAADAYAAGLMLALGRSPKPMGDLLVRLTGEERRGPFTLLRRHPPSQDRLAALVAQDRAANGPPLLNEEEWRALKSICN